MLTVDQLKIKLSYDPFTGIFTRLASRQKTRVGKIAGCIVGTSGYVVIYVNGKQYYAHRLAWLYVHGAWPTEYIDHIDCDKANNRITNLRECSHQENRRNNKLQPNNNSGYKGVSWNKRKRKWVSVINHLYKQTHIGYYACPHQAAEAYNKKAIELHGEFARLNIIP